MTAPDRPDDYKPERDEKGYFLPGHTANPKGVTGKRHEVKRRIREILEMAGPTAALRLSDLINDPDPKVALKVSCYVIDQVIGRPKNDDAPEEGKPTRVELTINGNPVRRIEAVDVDEDEHQEEEAVQ